MLKLFSRDNGAELTVNDSLKTVRYSATDESIQKILEMVNEFQHYKSSITGNVFKDRDAINASDYLRGIGATLNNPNQVNDIADLLDCVHKVFALHVEVYEVDEHNNTQRRL